MSTPASVSRLSRVDLPALVYPTKAIWGRSVRLRALRWVSLVLAIAVRSSLSRAIRATIRRRSVSNLVSPGPRARTPKPCWLKFLAPAAQPGEQVLEQRHLDLCHAFPGGGVLGEDVEDHRLAVDYVAVEGALQVALLCRGEAVVEDDNVDVEPLGDGRQLVDLSLAHEGRRIGGVALHQNDVDRVGTGCLGEPRQLLEGGLGLLGIGAPQCDTN